MDAGVFRKLTGSITPTGRKILVGWGNISKGERILFFLSLIIFPANLAKHFIFPDSYIRGILVDYLTLPFYLTEILILFFLFYRLALNIIRHIFKPRLIYLLFPLLLLPSLLVSDFIIPSIFRFGEILLWGGFSFWVAKNINWKKDRHIIVKFLSFGVSWVSLLAFLQFIAQRNIFGYWFFGEPTIYPSLGGVAKTSFLGIEVLRGYGTFPHPNVLGGILAVALPWLLAEGCFLPAGIGLLGLFASFSRLSWVCFLLGIISLLFLRAGKSRRFRFLLLSLPALLLVSLWLFPSLSDLSLVRRIELLQSAKEMIISSPLVGVGLGLFTKALPSFGIPSGPTLFLQPVHNIFALVAAESGLLVAVLLLSIFVFTFYRLWREKQFLLLVSLIQLVFLGMFDHYLYTLPQGLFLLSLTLGFSFPYSKNDGS